MGVVCLLMVGCSGPTSQTPEEPTFQLSDLVLEALPGQALPELEGKRVVVHVWATWCKPCLEEMPVLASVQHRMAQQGVALLMVSDETEEELTAFLANKSFQLPFARLEGSFTQWGLNVWPTALLFDENGQYIDRHNGAWDWSSAEAMTWMLGTPL